MEIGGACMDELTEDISNQFITRAEAATLWNCTRGNIHYHINKGHLREYDVGGIDMVLRSEVEQLITRMAQEYPEKYLPVSEESDVTSCLKKRP